jgi:putative redox protein
MAVVITGTYEEGLRTRARHGPSGTELSTAAPVDNRGDGSSFSPTDLVATALGTCVLTVMGIAAADDGIPFDGATFRVEKHMEAGPRRIAALPVVVRMPPGLTADQRERLERAGSHCPVHHSLRPDIDAAVRFEYPDPAPPPPA